MSQPEEEDYPMVGLVLPARTAPALLLGTVSKDGQDPAQNRDNFTHTNINSSEVVEDHMAELSFWKAYQDEALAQDKEFVQDRNGNLDAMLVFAGLYSAVLTAFLIDSTKLLQQDPADVTNTLLLNIAQAQWRIETGNTNTSMPPVQLPAFVTPTTARVVNCLWYMALMLSLGAAMLAMLAKEWLGAYLKYETRDPQMFARIRQGRFRALWSWSAITVIDFLPMLFYISLLLFTLGLIVQTWWLDSTVSKTIISASLVAGALFILTVILGSTYISCPYQSRISGYIRPLLLHSSWYMYHRFTALKRYWRIPSVLETVKRRLSKIGKYIPKPYKWLNQNGIPKTPESSNVFNLKGARNREAMEWFLDHARDQNNVNALYRWMNGSGLPRVIENIDMKNIIESNKGLAEWDQWSMLSLGQQSVKKLGTLYEEQYYDLVYSEGAIAARHAIRVSEVCMRMGSDCEKREPTALSLINHALLVLDEFWKNELPPMTAASNAFLVAAELRITACALKALPTPESPSSDYTSIAETDTPRQTHTLIEVRPVCSLPELQARANRGLCRGGLLLYYHLQHQTHMTPSTFSALISSLLELSTELERFTRGHSLPFTDLLLNVKIGNAHPTEYRFTRESFFGPHGLLNGLVSLLDTSAVIVTPSGSNSGDMATKLIKLSFQLASRIFRQFNPGSPSLVSLINDFEERNFNSRGSRADILALLQLLDITYLALVCVNTRLPAEFNHAVGDQITHVGSTLLNTCIKALVSRTNTPEGLHCVKDCLQMNRAKKVSFLKAWVDATGSIGRDTVTMQHISDTTMVETTTLRLLGCGDAVPCILEKGTGERDESVVKRLCVILKAISSSGTNSDGSEVLRQLHEHYRRNQENISMYLLVQYEVFTHLVEIARQNTEYKGRVMYIASRILLYTKQTSPPECPESEFYPLRLYSEFCPSAEFLLGNLSSNWDIPEVPEDEAGEPDLKHRVLKAFLQITRELAPLVRGRGTDEGGEYPEEFKGTVSKLVGISKEISCPEVQEEATRLLCHISGEGSISRVPSVGSLPGPSKDLD